MKLYLVGIGPGEPQLITYKAYNILSNVKLLFYPTGGKNSLALKIIENFFNLNDKQLIELYFPMKKGETLKEHWEALSDKIFTFLQESKLGALITLGDPAFYSTSYYLKDFLLKRGIVLEVIPGISSFSATSAKLLSPLTLGEEEAVITIGEKVIKDGELYRKFDSIVVLKCHKFIAPLLAFAQNNNYEVYIGHRVSMPEESLFKNPQEVPQENWDYFTLMILRRKK